MAALWEGTRLRPAHDAVKPCTLSSAGAHQSKGGMEAKETLLDGKSQKATCESKALEGLFPPHWVHKLDTVQFLCPLQGHHPHGWLPLGWTAKIRAAL